MKTLLITILLFIATRVLGQNYTETDSFYIIQTSGIYQITNDSIKLIKKLEITGDTFCIPSFWIDTVISPYEISGDTIRLKNPKPTPEELIREYLKWCVENGKGPTLESFDEFMEKRKRN